MYRVIYKHRLKSGKNLQDFEQWLDSYWTVQQSWGAHDVRFWRDSLQDKNIFFCEYRVKDIKSWTKAALYASSRKIISDLESITDTKHIIITKDSEPQPLCNLSKQQVA